LGIETRSPPTLDVVRGRRKRALVDGYADAVAPIDRSRLPLNPRLVVSGA
jgi:hypothetical protein